MPLRLSGLASGMDTESIVSELMKAQRLKATRIERKITKLEWTQEKWKALNTKLYSFYTGPLAKLRLQGTFDTKTASSSNENKVTLTAAGTAPVGTHSLKILQLASAQYVTGSKLGTDQNNNAVNSNTKLIDLGLSADTGNTITVDAGNGAQTLTITEKTTVSDLTNMLKKAGLNASFDTSQNRFFISSKESGYSNAFSISAAGSVDLTLLGLSTITKTDNGDGTVTVSGGPEITLVGPRDSKILYNNAEITSSSNTITVNGLTLTLKGLTAEDETLTLSVSDNTKAVYDTIKDFVKQYNELIKEMNEAYSADSAKGFEPLTDEERAAMSESQIDKWEQKIKDSLLRRDETVSDLLSSMRTILNKPVKIGGKDYSFSTFGISSVNYTEKGLLHIYGDSEDNLASGLEDKLMKALTEEPDKVKQVMNSIAGELYDKMTKDMKSTTLRSALTFYNDKQMAKTITEYQDDLKRMEKKLAVIEDRYYKQFAALESAMAKMNSQNASLMSMLGVGQRQ